MLADEIAAALSAEAGVTAAELAERVGAPAAGRVVGFGCGPRPFLE